MGAVLDRIVVDARREGAAGYRRPDPRRVCQRWVADVNVEAALDRIYQREGQPEPLSHFADRLLAFVK
ncbi:hypothetical protein KGQ19_00340 [Catenulispora sp. NL8]|uniref:Uncharacterized protein n=1 Tax=Catenulispora pinistramenti TaxID=2705254 RepID=A0ABS5KJ00_9ACTN|nr:hypothetical protein [Catenulispora pinistramenti]MBS2545306.1 hypothetical protein [Catenulispora pinistramenti]